MGDDESIFYDTISVNSTVSLNRRDRGSKYMSLSRNTIYHSAEDFEMIDMNDLSSSASKRGRRLSKVSGQLITYTQWRNRSWNRFRDGEHVVDFVLGYVPNGNTQNEEKRKTFEAGLMEEGLLLEYEETQWLHFVKIYAPREVLARFTEILKLRMPIKEIAGQDEILDPSFDIRSIFSRMPDVLGVRLNPNIFPSQQYSLTAEYSRDKDYLFDSDSENFFSTSVRTMIVAFILERQKFNNNPEAVFDVGIQRLLSEGVYKAAYPLHDGSLKKEGSMRSLLFKEWAQVSKWIKYQPIDAIKDYFGVKYALYFAWLGFYTHMLIPAAIVGLICFIYGIVTIYDNTFANEVCSEGSNITMCPRCDRECGYWQLQEACTYTRISYLFDNPFTLVFAIFMSFWATLYLELWKRYSAEITHRWGLTGFDAQAEHPRPSYLARLSKAKRRKLNVVTRVLEPVVPFWRVKLPSVVLSFSVAFLWILVALGTVSGVVIFRMSQYASKSIHYYSDSDSTFSKFLTVPITAAIINLVCILILNQIYDWLAVILTEMEHQRTQTEFDDSLNIKIYMFQFVNYYSAIFYIAFLKGKFVGYPKKYNRIFNFRQEECEPGGCLMELCIQLAIIMIGQQTLNAFLEMFVPILTNWYNTIMIKIGFSGNDNDDDLVCCSQWTEDYKLIDIGPRGLFNEYLEMVIQYGFVTIFVAAFPLAPLFALINNIFEMRLDAKKFLKYYRRPVPQREKNIGVWLPILDIIGRISVVTNAFIIAFSSNLIPRLVYMAVESRDKTDTGLLNFTLSSFNTSDFPEGLIPETNGSAPICHYFAFRNAHDEERKYKKRLIYWHILAARLAFIVVFQNIVGFVIMAIQSAIPDISHRLSDQIKRETYLTSEIIIKQETMRAKTGRGGSFRGGVFHSHNSKDKLATGDTNGDATNL